MNENEPFVPAALPEPIQKDRVLYRSTVWGLVAVAVLSTLGAFVLPLFGIQSTDSAIGLGMAALVALSNVIGKNNP